MIVVLTGGTGGAKFVHGLRQIVPPQQVAYIVNTGDDFEHIGLHVAPIGLSQHSEVQEDAIAQWRSAVYAAPAHLTPPGPMPPGFPPDSVPRGVILTFGECSSMTWNEAGD